MPRKSTFMDATVAAEFMPEALCGYYRHSGDYHIALSRLGDDNIICGFISVLEITVRL